MSRTAYLVVRRALDADGSGCEDQFVSDTGSRVPLRLFSDRVTAEACAAALLADARRELSPFTQIGGYISEGEFEQLAALGLPVDCPDDSWNGDWRVWWDMCQDLITDEQRAAVWSVFAGQAAYEVLEVEVGDE